MKRIIFLVATSIASFAYAATYTLEQAIAIALENNTDIKVMQETLKEAQAKVNEAYGNAWPSLSLSGQYQKAFDQFSAFSSGSSNENPFVNSGVFMDPSSPAFSAPTAALAQDLGNMMDFSSLTKDYTTAIQLELTQVLYAQGKISTGVAIAKQYDQITRDGIKATQASLQSEITQSFNQILYFKAAIDLYQQSIELANNHLQIAETSLANGLANALTVNRARLQIRDLESDLDKMQSDLRLAQNALLLQMGLAWDPEVNFVGELTDPGTSLALPDTNFTTVLSKRSEIKQLKVSEDMQKEILNISKADYHPMIVAGATAGWISASNGALDFDFQPDQKVYIAFQMNLFNGFQTREKMAQNKTDIAKIRLQRDNAEKGIRLQIEKEHTAALDAYRRIALRKETIELAEQTLEMSEVAYANGQATQLEFLDASLNVRKARLEYLGALQEFHNAFVRLSLATGNL